MKFVSTTRDASRMNQKTQTILHFLFQFIIVALVALWSKQASSTLFVSNAVGLLPPAYFRGPPIRVLSPGLSLWPSKSQQVQQQQQQQPQSPILSTPVVSTRQIQYVPVASQGQRLQPIPQVITVEPNQQPVQFLFKSQSSPLVVRQVHIPSPQGSAGYESTTSHEAPHVVRHQVVKPVIQELRETIQPFRKVIQEVRPVLEQVQTIVPRERLPIQPLAPLSLWQYKKLLKNWAKGRQQAPSRPVQPIPLPPPQQQEEPIEQQQIQQQQQEEDEEQDIVQQQQQQIQTLSDNEYKRYGRA